MTTWLARATRCGAVIILTTLTQNLQCAAPAAHAIAPPPIDPSRLPEAVPPAPPQLTVQREMCAVPKMVPVRDSKPGHDLSQVWQLSRGSGQRVAIIDTGVSPHPRLPDVSAGGDYVSTGDGRQDCDGHGTAVAGIIAAAPDPDKTDNFSGIAPDVTLISIRQSSAKFAAAAEASATGFGDVDTLAKAVRTAADLGASVINISSVACVPVGSGLDDRALGAALAYAVDIKNAVVVGAAGNTGGPAQCPTQQAETTWDTATVAVSPAWYDDYVLTVGSVNARGEPSSFSLPGPWVDLAAPGEAVISLSLSGDGLVNSLGGEASSVSLSGTSYAAPVASGVAALIRARFPKLTAKQVMQRIKATAHHPPKGWDPLVGNGVIDVLAAVSSDAPSNPPAASHTPPVPIVAPALTPRPDRPARSTAFTGAAICLAVLAVTPIIGMVIARLRRVTSD